jgi:predicted O-methyltransferase YrrM
MSNEVGIGVQPSVVPLGMNEAELEQLVSIHASFPPNGVGCMEPEYYGGGRELRRYGLCPPFMPICCMSTHGVALWDYPQNYQLATNFPAMLVNSHRMKIAWLQRSKIRCFVITNPFILYRRRQRIRRVKNPIGSIAFFSHSTAEIDVHVDVANYIEQLRALPEAFQPVTVCLHFRDVEKGLHREFISRGVKCVSAGHWLDPKFIERFYAIVAEARYATSNSIGSYVFYCVELGIPFSLCGDEPVYFNRADLSLPKGSEATAFFLNHAAHQKAMSLFAGVQKEINVDQKRFVDEELGVDGSISRFRLAIVLYSSHLRCSSRNALCALPKPKVFRKLMSDIKRRLKTKLFESRLGRSAYLVKHGLVRASRIFTHMTQDELISIHQVARSVGQDSVCVEIGSYLGASSCFIASALSPDSRIICIDTWQNDAMRYEDADTDAEKRDTHAEFVRNTHRFRDKIIQIRKWSHDAIPDILSISREINFLFIDGDHNYEGVKRDWDLYSPLLPPGALVAFHDTGWAEGVQRVVREDVVPIGTLTRQLPNLQIFRLNVGGKPVVESSLEERVG